MSRYSFVTVAPDRAKQLAEKTLQDIAAQRKANIQRHVQRRTEELNSSFFRRVFRIKPLSHEQVEEMERSLPDLWANTIWEIEHWDFLHQQELCERVLVAVKIGEPIQLSLEDAGKLGAHL